MNSGWGPPANTCCCTDTGGEIPRRRSMRSRDEGRPRTCRRTEEEEDTGGGTETAHPLSPPHCHRCVLCSDHHSDGGECWVVSTTQNANQQSKIVDVMAACSSLRRVISNKAAFDIDEDESREDRTIEDGRTEYVEPNTDTPIPSHQRRRSVGGKSKVK